MALNKVQSPSRWQDAVERVRRPIELTLAVTFLIVLTPLLLAAEAVYSGENWLGEEP